METLVIKGKKKSDFDIFITLAKKLGLIAELINEEDTLKPNKKTLNAMGDVRKGKLHSATNVKDLMRKLKE